MKVRKNFIFTVMALILVTLILYPTQSYAEDDPVDNMSSEMETVGNPLMLQEGLPETSGQEVLPETKEEASVMSLLDLIKKGGIVGYLIILLSVISLGLIIDYSITIRKSKILPSRDITALQALIKNRNLKEVDKLDKDTASFLSKVTIAGLRESHLGYQSMIKAMEDAGEALASGIARKIEHLNVIGNISPMMGLLGTVIGMLRCFNEISHAAGAIEPKQLAGGIFEALITTCMGLIVAIPSLYSYAIFRNRIDEYTGEAALEAEQLVSLFKSDQNEK
ncbi:MAG: MotA/TolQ/ExbB proton channel family protein [Deltaproteobacteria bacterium]|nr:MotA/TolQ/ExbB proton channel family protein [Deltaproteobacteria bacterium]